MGRRTVVAFEANNLRTLEILLEAQNIADLRAPPSVDRLVVVSDAADVIAALGEKP